MSLLRFYLPLLAAAGAVQADTGWQVRTLVTEPYAVQFELRNNGGSNSGRFVVEAGQVLTTTDGGPFVALVEATATVPAHESSTLSVPAAALSTKAVWKGGQPLAGGRESRVAPLVEYLKSRPDVPRETSQLVVFALTEDINFADWQKASAAARGRTETQGELTVALDALTILRTVAPGQTFALAADGGLKLRALHDPLLRAKALQLYGLVVPGDAPAGGVAPDLGQLLHTKPGDNCPICRMREQMQRPADLP